MHKISSRPRAVAWANTDVIAWMRAQVAAAGGDPSTVPDEQYRFIRLPELKRLVGLSSSTIYRLMAEEEGKFPRPVLLGGAKVRRPCAISAPTPASTKAA
jgi:predicted DNA-binding transcriptional regulator AlpA